MTEKNRVVTVPGVKVENGKVIANDAPRNAPCPCGSGKKYKKCHGDASAHAKAAAPKQDLKGYRKATVEEELKLTKSGSAFALAVSNAQRIEQEINTLKANLSMATRALDDARIEIIRFGNARKEALKEIGLDPEDKEAARNQDGVIYVRKGKAPKKSAKPNGEGEE